MNRTGTFPSPSRPALLSALLCAALAGSPAAGQGTIELRQTVRLEPGQPLTLGAIADLSGPDAIAWATLALEEFDQPPDARPTNDRDADSAPDLPLPTTSAWRSVTLDDVRHLLEARQGVRWERLILRGSSCDVAWVIPAIERPEPVAPTVVQTPAIADGPTVRSLATSRIALLLAAPEEDVRIEFADQDAKLLDTPTSGRIVELQPIGRSDRMAMSVRVYEGERIVADGSFRARVQVRRDVLVTRDSLSRGDALSRDNTIVESRWIGATDPASTSQDAIGQTAKGKLRPGQIVTPQDIQPAVVVHKGDLVNVDCLSGSIVLRRTMRATQSGRDGEVVDLQALSGRATARARMNGAGRAVMLIDGSSPATASRRDPGAESPDTSLAGANDAGPTRQVQVGSLRISRNPSRSEGERVDRYTRLADARVADDDSNNQRRSAKDARRPSSQRPSADGNK